MKKTPCPNATVCRQSSVSPSLCALALFSSLRGADGRNVSCKAPVRCPAEHGPYRNSSGGEASLEAWGGTRLGLSVTGAPRPSGRRASRLPAPEPKELPGELQGFLG